MPDIDQTIFDEIARYEEGELGGPEREAVAQKLQTDERYRRHLAYYRTVTRAIARSTLPDVPDTDPEAELFRQVREREHRAARWRERGWWLASSIAVGIGIFYIGMEYGGQKTQTAPGPEIKTPAIQTTPVAEIPAASGEKLMGGSGIVLPDSAQWITLKRNVRTERYLKLDQQFFLIPRADGNQPLEAVQDSAMLRLLLENGQD